MATTTIPELIINSPYSEPNEHWKYDPQTRTFSREIGRRPAGYVKAPGLNLTLFRTHPGIFVELPLVNKIRPRGEGMARDRLSRRDRHYETAAGSLVRAARTRRPPLFFCQLESVETLIWLTEASPAGPRASRCRATAGRSRGLLQNGDGKRQDDFMAMLIAWHVLNKVTYPQDKRFSKPSSSWRRD